MVDGDDSLFYPDDDGIVGVEAGAEEDPVVAVSFPLLGEHPPNPGAVLNAV